MIGEGFWLKSVMFTPVEGEDQDTNPGCFGKAFSDWVCSALEGQGFDVEGAIPEDWGWCVMVARDPYLVWVGCGNVQEDPLPHELTWHCFVVTEVPFWRFWVRWTHSSEIRRSVGDITFALEAAFKAEPRITLVSEP